MCAWGGAAAAGSGALGRFPENRIPGNRRRHLEQLLELGEVLGVVRHLQRPREPAQQVQKSGFSGCRRRTGRSGKGSCRLSPMWC